MPSLVTKQGGHLDRARGLLQARQARRLVRRQVLHPGAGTAGKSRREHCKQLAQRRLGASEARLTAGAGVGLRSAVLLSAQRPGLPAVRGSAQMAAARPSGLPHLLGRVLGQALRQREDGALPTRVPPAV